jgi:hypothetical protein
VGRALTTVAEVEDRPLDDVLIDVMAPTNAILRVSVDLDKQQLGAPIRVASAMLETLTRATEVSARAAVRERGTPIQWQEAAVRDYLDRVVLERIEDGSFVMKAILPEHIESGEEAMRSSTAGLTARLVTDLRRLENFLAAPTFRGLPAIVQFEGWPFGVEVVQGLAHLDQAAVQAASINVLSADRGPKSHGETVRFDAEALALAREISVELTEQPTSEVAALQVQPPMPVEISIITIEGTVVTLARPSITVEAVVDGAQRRVRIAMLPQAWYELAIEAHRTQTPVRVTGQLTLRRTSAALRDLTGFALVAQ